MTTTVLLDFDNVYPPSAVPLSRELASHDISTILDLLSAAGIPVGEVAIRVYGGWRESGAETRRASEALQALPMTGFFPTPHPDGSSMIRGSIELVLTLAAHPQFDLGDTYVRRSRPPQVRLQQHTPDGCALSSDNCPARILRAFTQGGKRVCPAEGCNVMSSDAFVTHDQKMVDTLMACDLLELARDASPEVDAVVAFTSDRDIVPPIVAAADSTETRIAILDPNGQWQAEDVRVIQRAGATYLGNVEY